MTVPVTTQQRYPWKAALRTAIETAIPLVGLVALAFIAAGPELAAFADQFWPGTPIGAWIVAAVTFVSASAGLLARLAALPQVDALMQRIFKLGSSPAADRGKHAA
ncbi:hypothetical protein [Agrococcus sp. Marseille-Q4369]|uniref:hypothetical protein n=1 Tax=Agrococcus sp. Marseille-Q4369 TaxID=2810513 RepID=UPI001B8CAEB2|nr:hypothetical protein [Agrococcus sp. Marseille-Q4369]QUW18905.1 hypothetical protein JSQ78_00525 [Agrococcus sp. Marseille-Q4369]